ncbi:hypothetical protein BCBBV1cgp25 [Bacillus phage BCASJ1c]|uniref:25 n=1 Tax=Bacillus phage BCASJ1c TaxID=294382 RepID=Q5YA85_9CAUD|nr:hypothetical protein BCBBV1cgp25 [Bacillus phage BCASJ1c]AAU85072.1 25 [Bacillus phage BCASJ1c]
MDYNVFFAEVAQWVNDCNQMAVKYGMQGEEFWTWVTSSMAELSNKYNNAPLVKKQMSMMFDWLHEIYQNGNRK